MESEHADADARLLRKAFYLPNKDRQNFAVLVSAHVNRVVPASDQEAEFKAESVEFEHKGQVYTVHANKEVILSAGCVCCAIFYVQCMIDLFAVAR